MKVSELMTFLSPTEEIVLLPYDIMKPNLFVGTREEFQKSEIYKDLKDEEIFQILVAGDRMEIVTEVRDE